MIRIIKKIINAIFNPIVGEVLMLHSITQHREKIPKEKLRYSITPDYLESLIKEYRSKGFRFIALDEVEQLITKQVKPKGKVACFTLDDGYADNFREAYPIFKQYNCPFTIYISTDYPISKEYLLTERQIYELSQDSLCTIGAHTKHHFRLSKISETDCYDEILENKLQLEKIIKKEVTHFSYPYGDCNERVVSMVKEIGFHTAVCAWGDSFRASSNPFLMPRKEIFLSRTSRNQKLLQKE